jgi:Na+/H+ antiporter NhaA
MIIHLPCSTSFSPATSSIQGLRLMALRAAGAFLTGIDFTMSLFIAGLAYSPATLDAAKLGILGGSTISAVIGLSMLVVLTSREQSALR